jgi:hypothetical protein
MWDVTLIARSWLALCGTLSSWNVAIFEPLKMQSRIVLVRRPSLPLAYTALNVFV